MIARPGGIASLQGVVAGAAPNATVTMPAAWVRDLLAYLEQTERAAGVRAEAAE